MADLPTLHLNMQAAITLANRTEAESFVRSMDADPEWIEKNWDNLFGQALRLVARKRSHIAGDSVHIGEVA